MLRSTDFKHVSTKLAPSDIFKYFLAISPWRLVISSPKLVINLPRTYEKLHCKGEPYRFSG